jgi:hypothetical protein
MDRLRMVMQPESGTATPCSRCGTDKGQWDRIAGKAYCPQCEEAIVLGQQEPLVERTQKTACAVCGQVGTVCYLTFPLESPKPVEMDLCPEHFRSLMARRLGPFAFHQLIRQLQVHGLGPDEVFLLHDAFYDGSGRALQPITETLD